mmetsp:Transcript_403/g.741  ORF Transcript_403/g.741 Transcript_403/m.741 type:complete len:380 (+) Transcript_403:39-1178(+)|eukprot:CAMPEP_0117430162 /NCGR_PEP_ID=MMETSP0758-20121206/9683_1 /TAXON_ID=63605 /ORGANISM="Percolomonas cosmopolitus, Strain AE-1 (ATCC 50343)" /LENGTH=379 /DNA_ID=CAMNT_0005217869 /DNA_START=29 /DNA_END=1168 /DNA_ORIENTATION=+
MVNDQFKRYGSLTNHYVKGFVEGMMMNIKETTDDTKWVVTEKVHGANFSFTALRDEQSKEGYKLKMGKRTSYLDESDKSFFPEDSAEYLLATYTSKMAKLWEIASKEEHKDTLQKIIVYGEFFGGFYPTEKSKKFKKAIQRGVFYTDDYEFYAFDVRKTFETVDGSTYNTWCTHEESIDYWKAAGFKIYAYPILIGTFKECMNYDIQHPTTIPEKFFKLKPLETGCHRFVHNNNRCEGVVIKPFDKILRYKNNRLIIKKKNDDFLEVRMKPVKDKKVPKPNIVDNETLKIWKDMEAYITTQRIDNVVSKMGIIKRKDLSKLIGKFSLDILDEFKKENPEIVENIEKEQWKVLKKNLGRTTNPIVHSWFKKYEQEEEENK